MKSKVEFTRGELRALRHFIHEAIIFTANDDDRGCTPDIAEEMPASLRKPFERAARKIREAVV